MDDAPRTLTSRQRRGPVRLVLAIVLATVCVVSVACTGDDEPESTTSGGALADGARRLSEQLPVSPSAAAEQW